MEAEIASADHKPRLFIVDDETLLAAALRRWFERIYDVEVAATVQAALQRMSEGPGFDLILLDFNLPDGVALDVAEAALSLSPQPQVIVMTGDASAREAFQLGALGVTAYVQKPVDKSTLLDVIAKAPGQRPPLDVSLGRLVGQLTLPVVQERVRRVMVREALGRTGANRSQAAKILGISRQVVQSIVEAGAPDER